MFKVLKGEQHFRMEKFFMCCQVLRRSGIPKNPSVWKWVGGFLSRNRNLFPNSKMLSLDSVLISCKNLLLSRQVVLVKKSCLIVVENAKCRNSWFKIKESHRFFSNALVFRVWATDSAFATTGKQPQSRFCVGARSPLNVKSRIPTFHVFCNN